MENKPTFQELVQSEEPTLVDFYADWCGPCQAMNPILTEFASQMKGKVKVIKINVDKNAVIADAYHVKSIPTLLIFKNGQAVGRHSGALQLAELISFIKPHL